MCCFITGPSPYPSYYLQLHYYGFLQYLLLFFFFRFDLVSFLSFSNSSSVFFFFNEAVIHVCFLILLLHDRFFFSLLLMVLFFSFDATVKVATRGKKKVADNTKRKVTSEGAACSLTYRQ